MAGGGGDGKSWIYALVGGGALIGVATLAHESMPEWLHATLLAIGGLGVVFGSCESMIKSVEGIGQKLGWNRFVAGTFGGLASNIPELVMLGFVLAAAPRVGFIVTMLTLHVGALVFGLYSGLLPRDSAGNAGLPAPLVKVSTDLFAAAAGILLGTGAIMVMMTTFDAGDHGGNAFSPTDLYVLGAVMLFVEGVALWQLVSRFSGEETSDSEASTDVEDDGTTDKDAGAEAAKQAKEDDETMGVGAIVFYGLLGIAASVVGGHAVGDFAEILVGALTERGYSEMVGALILSVFAAAGAIVMVVTSHVKGMYDIALASASGQINQVPFVVLPVVFILLGVYTQLGFATPAPGGGALPIDLETTSVVFLAFPPMLMMWKAVQDDGKLNWLETASMVAVFGIVIYFLAAHG